MGKREITTLLGFPYFDGEGEWYVLNNLVVAWGNTRYLDEPARTVVRRHILAAYKAARRELSAQRREQKAWALARGSVRATDDPAPVAS